MFLKIGENYLGLHNLYLYNYKNYKNLSNDYLLFIVNNDIYININDNDLIFQNKSLNFIDNLNKITGVYSLINLNNKKRLITNEEINLIKTYYNNEINNLNDIISKKIYLYNKINNIIENINNEYYIDNNRFIIRKNGEIIETLYNMIYNIKQNNFKNNLELNDLDLNINYSLYPPQLSLFNNITSIYNENDNIKLLQQNQYKSDKDYLDDFCSRNETLENTFGLEEEENFVKNKDEFTLLNWNVHYFINSCNIFKHTNGKIEYISNDIKDKDKIMNINKIKDIINKYKCDYVNLQKYNIIEYDNNKNRVKSNFWDLEGLEKYKADYKINNINNKHNISIGINKEIKHSFIKGFFNDNPYIITKSIINNKELYIINIYINNLTTDTIKSLEPLINFLKRINYEKKNFIITGGYNVNYNILEEIFKSYHLYLTNINRLMIPYFEKIHTSYKNLSIEDYILCSDHFFYDFITKDIKIINVNYSDHLPIMFKFTTRNKTDNYLDFGDINNYVSKIFPKLYNSIKPLINVYYKDFTKEEYLKSFEDINIGFIYYNLKHFFKPNIIPFDNKIGIKKEIFKQMKIPENSYFTHSITFWNVPGNDTYTIKERLCEEKLDNNYNINKPIELEEGGLNKYFLGASFNFALDATEAFSPFYNNGIEGRTYLLKLKQDLMTINLFSNQKDNNVRRIFYEIFLTSFKYYYKNNALKILYDDKFYNTSVGLLANMLQLFILPFYILIDNNNVNHWSSEIFYGLIITDFMPNIIPNYFTEKDLIYVDIGNNNYFSNCEIYIPYARKFVEITHIYADYNIYTIDEWVNEYKNYFIRKFNELYDIIKYKEDQFGYHKKILTNMYFSDRYSSRFFMNIYNSILNHIIFNLKIYNYDIFTKNYDKINSILNHISSFSSFYSSHSIKDKILLLINHLLNNFFYLKENILSNVINKEYYRRYFKYNKISNNKYVDNNLHLAFIPDIFNHRQLNNIFKLLFINKDLTNNNLEQITNILNNYSFNKNININDIKNYINNVNPSYIDNLLYYLDLIEEPFMTVFENPLIIIYDIYKLQYDKNVLTDKNSLLYDEIIKIITKKLNHNKEFITNYNKYITTYLNNNDFKNIYPDLYNYLSKYSVINNYISNQYSINDNFNNDCIYIYKPLDNSNNIIMNNIKFKLNDYDFNLLFNHFKLLRELLFDNQLTIKEMSKNNRTKFNDYNNEFFITGFNPSCDYGFKNLNDLHYNIFAINPILKYNLLNYKN